MDKIIIATSDQLREIFRQELELYHNSKTSPMMPQESGRVIFDLDQLCEYAKLSKQTVYKLTGKGLIPHSKRGKRLYFEKSQVDTWLLEHQVGQISDIARKADEYLLRNQRRRK